MLSKISFKDHYLNYFFLFLFSTLGIYVRYFFLDAPITPYALQLKILPNLNRSPWEIILSEFHSELAHWRMIFSNYLYEPFGLSGTTYRAFPFIVSICTIFFIYKFTKKRIGKEEAGIGVLLFSTCYYSYWSIIWPHFPGFYFLASLMTIYYLLNAIEKRDCFKSWIAFSVITFLNLTNVILPFLFLPSIFLIGIWYTKKIYQQNNGKQFTILIYQKFLLFLMIPFLLAFYFYQLKGVDLFGNALDIFLNEKFVDPIFSPVAGQEYLENIKSPLGRTKTLLSSIFLELNFYTGDLGTQGNIWSHGWFFLLFLIGKYKLFKNQFNLFVIFSIIFYPGIPILSIVFGMEEERFLGFILPFYLITVATGFWFLFCKINRFISSLVLRKAINYIAGFFIFAWLIPLKPIWSQEHLDDVFGIRGIRYIRDYLKKNIGPDDIILNVTRVTQLRSNIDDALSMSSYEFYLEEFFKNHRLELLPSKKGRFRVWLILQRPKDIQSNLVPFYLPPGINLNLAASVKGGYLYSGELNLNSESERFSFFNDPFWAFIFARYYQEKHNYQLAEKYYRKVLSFGLNLERSFYNLGLMHSTLNYPLALEFFKKAVQVIETPTQIPKNTKILLSLPKIRNNSGMSAKLNKIRSVKPIKSFWLQKNNIRRKVWIKDKYIYYNGRLFSEFYITSGFLSYLIFAQTGNDTFYRLAKSFFDRGLKLFPLHSQIGLINQLLNKKPKDISIQKIGKIYVADLNGIYEEFPPKSSVGR